ncbi:MAG: dihydrodipicolinate reductase [Rhodobacteraceae bacterium]|nr:dihydrodipicolinate reductase [Paracoccaceae bacterium]MAY45083.1 dihydrodipicolinate reductase [Paracoccaceae bacterium]
MRLALAATAAFFCAASPVLAEFQKIDTETDFRRLVTGKTLTRPMVRLQVSPQGAISGRGMTWDVTGRWSWQNGYFCRDLAWGGDDLGYNCQEVRVNGRKVRFTSDRGAGESAVFTLN